MISVWVSGCLRKSQKKPEVDSFGLPSFSPLSKPIPYYRILLNNAVLVLIEDGGLNDWKILKKRMGQFI